MAMDGDKSFSKNDSLVREQCKVFREKLKSTISALILSEKAPIDNKQVKNSPCSCNNKVAAWSQLSRYHISIMLLFFMMFVLFVLSILLPPLTEW